MKTRSTVRRTALAVLSSFAAACGGAGSHDPRLPPVPPGRGELGPLPPVPPADPLLPPAVPGEEIADSGFGAAAWTGSGYGFVWAEWVDSRSTIRFVRLDAQGRRVGGQTTVPEVEGSSTNPAIAWAGDGYGVVWSWSPGSARRILFARLDAEGRRTGPEVTLFSDDDVIADAPSIAWDGRRFGVSWWRSGRGIDFVLLDPDGSAAGDVVRLSESERVWAPSQVAAGPRGFVVAWSDFAEEDGDVFVAHVGPGGERDGDPVEVTPGAATGGSPALASTGAGFGLAFPGGPGGTELRLARLDAAGRPVGDTALVARREANSVGGPALAWTGRGWALAWEWRDAYTGAREVHAVLADEAGRPAGTPVQVSPSGGESGRAAIAQGAPTSLVVWSDDRDGISAVLAATLGEDGAPSEGRRVTGPGGAWEDGRAPVVAAGSAPGDPACAAMIAEGRPVAMAVPLGDGKRPVLVWTGDGYGVAWMREGGDGGGVAFLRLDDLGRPRGEVRDVVASGAGDATLAWAGDGFGVAWTDERHGTGPADPEIYFARLDASGAPVGEGVRVTSDGTRSEGARLAWNGREFGLAWDDAGEGWGNSARILFLRLSASGRPIGEPRQVAGAAAASPPALVWDGEGYGVVWLDRRDDRNHVYFARLDAEGHVRGEETRLSEEIPDAANYDLVWTGDRYVAEWTVIPRVDSGDEGGLYAVSLDAGGRRGAVVDLSGSARGASSLAAGAARSDVAVVGGAGMLHVRLDGGEVGELVVRPWPDDFPVGAPDAVWTGREYAIAGIDSLAGGSRVYFARVCP